MNLCKRNLHPEAPASGQAQVPHGPLSFKKDNNPQYDVEKSMCRFYAISGSTLKTKKRCSFFTIFFPSRLSDPLILGAVHSTLNRVWVTGTVQGEDSAQIGTVGATSTCIMQHFQDDILKSCLARTEQVFFRTTRNKSAKFRSLYEFLDVFAISDSPCIDALQVRFEAVRLVRTVLQRGLTPSYNCLPYLLAVQVYGRDDKTALLALAGLHDIAEKETS